jgi:hypothetical protein
MRSALAIVRALAIGWVVLSVGAVPLGLFAVAMASSQGIDGNSLSGPITLALGILLLVPGVGGLVLGSALVVLAKRSLAGPAEVRGPRRIVLAAGLLIAAGQVLVSASLGGPLSFFVGLGVAVAAGFIVVAVASARRREFVPAGAIAVALLGLGMIPIWAQALQAGSGDRRTDRAALIPADLAVAIEAAGVAGPDEWSVASIVINATEIGIFSESRDLPEELIGQPLRGVVLVDCAGSGTLEIATSDDISSVLLGTIPCRTDPQVLSFVIPGVTAQPRSPYVDRILVAMNEEGATGSMIRAMAFVAPASTPDATTEALLPAFVAAYGTEEPR